MKHFLFSTRLPDGREVCVAPVSVDAFEASGAHSLGDDSGYFIYEFDERQSGGGIEILAKATSYDTAMRMIDIFLTIQRRLPTIAHVHPQNALQPQLPPAPRPAAS